jgi:polysaccharide export outer membrane protein
LRQIARCDQEGGRPDKKELEMPHKEGIAARAKSVRAGLVGCLITACAVLAGCGPGSQYTDCDAAVFEQAGPVQLDVNYEDILKSRISNGPYRVGPGDLLAFQMPTVVSMLPEREGDDTVPYKCRVDSKGNVVLPIVGSLAVGGRTLSEIEAAIKTAYYPKYVLAEPSIVASVEDYELASVSVVGAVNAPGTYNLRSNELSLLCTLMKAGGIVDEGATAIHICRSGPEGIRSVDVPVFDTSIPARDAELADGDTVVVEAMEEQGVSVVGLVKSPGTYPLASKGRVTVMDALAFAGGVNDVADPQYARVYRQDKDGTLISQLIKLSGSSAVGASETRVKPGDIVVVEQTARTRTRLILSQIVKMGVGVNAGASVGP